MCNFNNSKVNRSIQLLDKNNFYFAITCRCCTATLLHNSLVYYQATTNVIVLVVIAPASATGARARHTPALLIVRRRTNSHFSLQHDALGSAHVSCRSLTRLSGDSSKRRKMNLPFYNPCPHKRNTHTFQRDSRSRQRKAKQKTLYTPLSDSGNKRREEATHVHQSAQLLLLLTSIHTVSQLQL